MPNLSHKTAIGRNTLSKPFRLALEEGFLKPGMTVLDYGCGRGEDVARLARRGYKVRGYDPTWRPGRCVAADFVAVNYVLNVLPDPAERLDVLRKARQFSRGLLMVAVRMGFRPEEHWRAEGDGHITGTGTFQKCYTKKELALFLRQEFPGAEVTLVENVGFVRLIG